MLQRHLSLTARFSQVDTEGASRPASTSPKSAASRARCLCALALTTLALLGCDDGGSSRAPADTAATDTDTEPVDTTPADTASDLAPDDDDDGDTAADTAPDATPPPVSECVPAVAEPAAPTEVTLGSWTVRADATSGAWSVTAAGASTPVLEGPGTCVASAAGRGLPAVRLGAVEPSVLNEFGAFQIALRETHLPAATGEAPSVETDADGLRMRWLVRDAAGVEGGATLRFSLDAASGGLRIALESSRPEWQSGELALACRPDEAFFGLGTQATAMDLRATTVPLWTQEQGIGKPADGGFFPLNNEPEAAYAPMGVLHSSAGYAAVLDHDAFTLLDLCERHDDRVLVRSHPDLPALVLVPGDSPRERLAALTQHFVGRLGALPRWALAPWNDAVGGPARLAEVAARLRDADVPSSAIWAEDWAGVQPGGEGYRLTYAWEWDPGFYPDLPADIDALHERGFAFLGYFNPFVVSTTRMYAEGEAGGYLIEDASGATYTFLDPGFRDASLVDLTNPDAVAWLSGYLRTAAADLGIDGWMADFAEWLPADAVLASGESAWRVHNRYPLLWQQANLDALTAAHEGAPDGADNFTFFARSGWASTRGGTAGLAPTLWAGDQNTDWGYDDGFPTVVPIGAHVGLAGVAIYGHDIAGYTAVLTPPTTKELYLRWSALGAFTPLMRTHHGSEECANWAFDRDAETLAHHRRYAILHTLLMPVLTSLVGEARGFGLPLWRHPFLVEPTRSGLWQGRDYQVFLGDDLLLAPVLIEGESTRSVRLPAAGWWPLFGAAPLSGEQPADGDIVTLEVAAPVTELPVFVRPGTALLLLAEPVDSFYGATDPTVSDYADVAGRYRVALYPAADGAIAATSAVDLDGSLLGSVSSASGWAVDSLAQAPSVAGSALPACDAVPAGTDCHDAARSTARLHGAEVTLTAADGATLTLSAPAAATWEVGVAGAAWGEWALPTSVTELSPDVPPPCGPEAP